MKNIVIKQICIDRLSEIRSLRVRVWMDQGLTIDHAAEDEINDDFDFVSEHYGILKEEKIIGSVRVSFHSEICKSPLPAAFKSVAFPAAPLYAFPSRLVIDPLCQGNGLGQILLDTAIPRCINKAPCTIAYTSITSVKESLLKVGFVVIEQKVATWCNRKRDFSLLALLNANSTDCP